MRTRVLFAVVVVVLGACASPAAPPQIDVTLAEGASTARSVDPEMLVDEASDPALSDVLERAGFAGANERTWTDRQGEVWRTVVRALRFDSPEGARTYLAWIDDNADSLIGPATRIGDGALAFEHHASDCCPNKDGPQALAATADGDLVWTVTLTGPGADAARAVALLPPEIAT